MFQLEELLTQARELHASDLHLCCGLPPKLRIDGSLRSLGEERLTEEDCRQLATALLGSSFSDLGKVGEYDRGADICGIRVRINVFLQQGKPSAAVRLLADHIPVLEDLHLPPAVFRFPAFRQGLVLVTGETGSGKSTTLAAVLQRINETRDAHILTLEDPIEYVYTPERALINQREIGMDTACYAAGLRAALREDPDVILIGEMRDLDTIETALTAAETGHLVFATLHTNSATETIDRIVGVFPAERQGQIRIQLSTTLKAVLSQQLLPRIGGRGRVAACELMMMNTALANLVREGKTAQMQSFLLSGAEEGSLTMDNALLQLVKESLIRPETALEAGRDAEQLKRRISIL